MSSDEQKQILKMVEDGKITADEAMKLIRALNEASAEDEIEVIETEAPFGDDTGSGSEFEAANDLGADATPEFEEVKARARRYAMVPLGVGVVFTVLASYWLFVLVQSSNYGFWFACAWFPLLLGILLVALSAGGMNARWLYVNVEQEPGEWPQHITLGIPVPLGLLGWLLRNFGHYARDMDRQHVDDILTLLKAADAHGPLIVNVDEGDHGERVQVYIG
jgi:SHOCT-like domain